MKFSTFIAVSSAFSSLAAAIPVEKRDIVLITKTDVVMTTVDVMTTIWVDGSSSVPTSAPKVAPQPLPAAAPKPKQHHKHVAPRPSAQAVPTPAPAPAPASTPAPAPAPATTPAPTPAPSPSPSPASSGSGGSGQVYSGDMTYYDVGLGSCGWTSTSNQHIVALSYLTMQNPANPNLNPLCGKMITIHYGGKTETAQVVDTCMGCQGAGDLDMSEGLFESFAALSIGRITSGMTWSFNS